LAVDFAAAFRGKGELQVGQIEGVPAREFLSIVRKSVRERWPVSAEQKGVTARRVAEIIENIDGKYSEKDMLTAARVQLEMDNSNIKNTLALEAAELSREKFEKLSSLESLITHSLADGPPSGPVVSDTPMPALEFVDVLSEEIDAEDTPGENT
jgi:hypothetical protein